MCCERKDSCKVGDTLTATASAAVTKYEWSLNGTVMATTATYEVPASAKDGDEIKVTVTAEDGETASDTVYVGGLTILKVEPLAQGETYKYVKAYFSSALTSLSPSEIEIRGKKDQKLYSIQTAVLASDGMAADLTLYGNTDSDSTTFLRANTTYVMTLTQNGQSTSLEFELPAYATDKIVTSVDMGKNTITTDWSGKTGETGATGIFNVAGKYDGNLGSLIGRTVNYQYDTDNNLTAFSVDDAEVVYGAMKFVNDANDLRKAYFKDALTGETYKVNRDSRTASKNFTWFYAAEDGDEFTPVANTTYNYTKLVLNPDGTVSTANLVQNFAQNLFVTDVEGTKVIQDKENAFDLDGYTIVKDDAYVSPDDLELGDVVFINTAVKFADVYNNELSGELSNVISGKLDIDEETYSWDGAQYYDEDDDVYKTLSTTDDEASQAYLNSLDTETDTTIWIARNKDIKYLAGTVVGQKKYTYTTYLVTETAKPYTESLKDKFNIGVFDGTTTSTVTIDLSQLKFYKGDAGKFAAKTDDDWGKTGATDIDAFGFTDKKTEAVTALDLSTDLAKGSLVKFMFDEDNNLVGFSDDENAVDASIQGTNPAVTGTSSLDGTEILGTAKSPNLKATSNKFVQDTGDTSKEVYTMGSYTNLWIWNEKEATHGATAKDDAFTKVVLTDFDNEIETDATVDPTLASHPLKGMSYRVDGTKLTDLVVHILNDDAYEDAETNTINGVLAGVTFKNDETDTAQMMNKITIYGTDGVKATYTANKDATHAAIADADDAKALAGAYVTLTQNKATEEITDLTVSGPTWNQKTGTEDDKLVATHATTNFHNDKLILATGGKELTTTSDGVIMKRYQKEGSWKYEVVDYTDVNVHDGAVDVWYNTTNVSSDGKKIQSNMIIVELLANAVTPVTATVTITGNKGTLPTAKKLSTANTRFTATTTGTGTIDNVQWYLNGAKATNAASEIVTAADLANPEAGDYVYVVFTTTDGELYTSDPYLFEDPVLATIASVTSGAAFTSGTTALTLKDQFGATFTPSAALAPTVTITGDDYTTATMSIATDGKMTLTLTGVWADDNPAKFTFTVPATTPATVVIQTSDGTAFTYGVGAS